MKHIERIFDAITGEITEVERDFTAAEIKQRAANRKENEAEAAKAEANAIAKSALLERMGITADEAKLLIG